MGLSEQMEWFALARSTESSSVVTGRMAVCVHRWTSAGGGNMRNNFSPNCCYFLVK